MVVGFHVVVVGSILLMQGCGTTRPESQVVEPPPAPQLPPRAQIAQPSTLTPKPAFQPPVSVEPATASGLEAGQTIIIEKGDLLSSIAYRYGVSAREIAELNGIKDPNKIRVGQKLLLPSYARSQPLAKKSKSSSSSASSTKSTSSASATAGAGEYVVKSGDSLSKIASRNGTTVKALRSENNLSSDMIRVGQKLKIPGGKAAADKPAEVAAPAAVDSAAPAPALEPAPAVESVTAIPAPAEPAPSAPALSADIDFEYTVKTGETIEDVARNFGMLKQDILSVNGLADGATLTAGQKLRIPMSSQ